MSEAVLGALAEARALGFLGPGPLEAHLASAETFALAIGEDEGPALDLGSGGGVPGLLLAAWYPDMRWTLLDHHRRRTSFLARTVAMLGWVDRVQVVRAAAEEVAHDEAYRGRFRIVTARSFGPPAVTAEIASGYLVRRGRLFVAEPPEPSIERWPAEGLAELGLVRLPTLTPAVAVLESVSPIGSERPRPWRNLERKPLW